MKIVTTALHLILQITSPVMISLLVLGLTVGVIKVATQIEDRSLGFVLKFFLVFFICYIFAGSWGNSVIEFSKQIWGNVDYFRL